MAVALLLQLLLGPLGLCVVRTLDELLLTLFGDRPPFGDCLLSWHSLGRVFPSNSQEVELTRKLMTLMSTKGEDIVLQVGARLQQRFRNTLPPLFGRGKKSVVGDGLKALMITSMLSTLPFVGVSSVKARFAHGLFTSQPLSVFTCFVGGVQAPENFSHFCAGSLLYFWLQGYMSTDTNPADRPREGLV